MVTNNMVAAFIGHFYQVEKNSEIPIAHIYEFA